MGRTTALAARYEVNTQVASFTVAERLPAMCGRLTFTTVVSSTTMAALIMTAMEAGQGFRRGPVIDWGSIGAAPAREPPPGDRSPRIVTPKADAKDRKEGSVRLKAQRAETRRFVERSEVEIVGDDVRLQILLGGLMEGEARLGLEGFPPSRFTRANAKSSAALAGRSRTSWTSPTRLLPACPRNVKAAPPPAATWGILVLGLHG
jgi:hypothetical protein